MSPDHPPLTLYWMTCGCVRRYEELDRNQRPYRCQCIEKGCIDYRTTQCTVCGKRFEFNKRGATPVYCYDCRVSYKISTLRHVDKNNQDVDLYVCHHPNALASAARFDCVHRPACISKYNKGNFLPCLNCGQYQPGEL